MIELQDEYVLSEVRNQRLAGKQVFFQGSRQMDNLSRRYYERELGAGLGPSPGLTEHFGYSEPLRRFIQRESFEPQANEIPNTMPSWLPGNDYMTNFKRGDPYVKIDDGYARLPGAGYEALHPELKGVAPEDYPDIHRLRILSDVAPYSREYNLYRQKIAGQAKNDTGLQIELDKIVDRVRQTKDSSIPMDRRRFTAPVDEISGTVEKASPGGITLKEYPGRVFRFSSVGLSAADMSARILGENNQVFPSCRTTKTLARPRGRIPAAGADAPAMAGFQVPFRPVSPVFLILERTPAQPGFEACIEVPEFVGKCRGKAISLRSLDSYSTLLAFSGDDFGGLV